MNLQAVALLADAGRRAALAAEAGQGSTLSAVLEAVRDEAVRLDLLTNPGLDTGVTEANRAAEFSARYARMLRAAGPINPDGSFLGLRARSVAAASVNPFEVVTLVDLQRPKGGQR
jgi:hypothetical protein